MSERYDAIIIGAGIIGAATAFELAKKGWKTLNIDKLPASGYGSTSNSCAIIRVHYSTWDGIAMAYEGYFYWHEWAKYLDAADERGLADFIECGALVMKTEQNGKLAKHCELADKLSIPYEALGPDAIEERLPIYEMKSYWPPKRMDDEGFAEPGEGRVDGGVFFPTAGYISDPQLATHNLQRAAEAKGGAFLLGRTVIEILQRDGRAAGVKLDDGREISSPVVINVAGPHSSIINEMAGATGDMNISTRALRQEVVHVPAPEGFDFEKLGTVVSDSDISRPGRLQPRLHRTVDAPGLALCPARAVAGRAQPHEGGGGSL
jgi:sarcosine oxidase subunit beta